MSWLSSIHYDIVSNPTPTPTPVSASIYLIAADYPCTLPHRTTTPVAHGYHHPNIALMAPSMQSHKTQCTSLWQNYYRTARNFG